MIADVTASVNALIGSHRLASAEIAHLTPEDPFLSTLRSFVAKTSPRIDELKQLHQDLLDELASVLAFFAEKPNSSVEQVFSTVLTFGFGFQKAAAEMSKLPPEKPISLPTEVPAVHVSQPTKGEDDATPTGTLAATPIAIRGSLTRGEFDEAIRTIHGGARRRERREASMASSIAGSIKLSRMLLDGSGTSARAGGTNRKPHGAHKRLASVFQ